MEIGNNWTYIYKFIVSIDTIETGGQTSDTTFHTIHWEITHVDTVFGETAHRISYKEWEENASTPVDTALGADWFVLDSTLKGSRLRRVAQINTGSISFSNFGTLLKSADLFHSGATPPPDSLDDLAEQTDGIYLQFPMDIDSAWVFRDLIFFQINRTVVARDPITVPVGQFDTYKILHDFTTSVNLWYAGVGLVKGVIRDTLSFGLPDGKSIQVISSEITELAGFKIGDLITGLEAEAAATPAAVPDTYKLLQNYPNPFNPVTTITYYLPGISTVRLEIYNALGQRVKTLVTGRQREGFHAIQWNGTTDSGNSLSSGVYFYRLAANAFSAVRRMVYLK